MLESVPETPKGRHSVARHHVIAVAVFLVAGVVLTVGLAPEALRQMRWGEHI
jgi:hypothetical protein